MSKLHCFPILFALTLAIAAFISAPVGAEAWKFGVMADTQWQANLDGKNPETVAVGIINQLNKKFIAEKVKFVIQVGDLAEEETNTLNGRPSERTMDTRALAAEPLYNAAIGFYPLRGNHDASQTAALELPKFFPQTLGSGSSVFNALNFSSPIFYGDANPYKLEGLTYSFDYDNARFILIDQFTRADGTSYLGSVHTNTIDQVDWIDNRLSTKPAGSHAFVFSHKNLIGQYHGGDLFGTQPADNSHGNVAARNAFYASMKENDARYFFGGHDHMHHRSLVTSPDGQASVTQIISTSDGYKFHIPNSTSFDLAFNVPAFGGRREIPLAQELFTIGYYIVTVDGPRVTVDHYSSPNGCSGDCELKVTPALNFSKRETFGYSLNGRQFVVDQGESYTVVRDSFRNTTARILAGTNESAAKVYDGRPVSKAVNTGWAPRDDEDVSLASNILTLWGMAEQLGSEKTDVYVLSLSFDRTGASLGPATSATSGSPAGMPTAIGQMRWRRISAEARGLYWVRGNPASNWAPTASISPTHTAWAVINHVGDFAVSQDF